MSLSLQAPEFLFNYVLILHFTLLKKRSRLDKVRLSKCCKRFDVEMLK